MSTNVYTLLNFITRFNSEKNITITQSVHFFEGFFLCKEPII